MNVSWIDWSITLGLLAFIFLAAYNTRKETRSVADFLAANRCAGKYILGGLQHYGRHGGRHDHRLFRNVL